MDNFDLVNFNEQGGASTPKTEEDQPLKIDLSAPATPPNGVSRKPLNLGGGPAPASAAPTPAPVAKPAPARPAPASAAPVGSATRSAGSRVTGVKTFFTKLHHGSVVFMDEQIAEWIQANPGVEIKQTNVCVGDVVAKKTEPNLIVMIWY